MFHVPGLHSIDERIGYLVLNEFLGKTKEDHVGKLLEGCREFL